MQTNYIQNILDFFFMICIYNILAINNVYSSLGFGFVKYLFEKSIFYFYIRKKMYGTSY